MANLDRRPEKEEEQVNDLEMASDEESIGIG